MVLIYKFFKEYYKAIKILALKKKNQNQLKIKFFNQIGD
jgi:hypothetical protein